MARAAAGDAEESTADLRAALDIVSATGGAKTRADITQAHRDMSQRWPDHPGVAELGQALRG